MPKLTFDRCLGYLTTSVNHCGHALKRNQEDQTFTLAFFRVFIVVELVVNIIHYAHLSAIVIFVPLAHPVLNHVNASFYFVSIFIKTYDISRVEGRDLLY